MVEVGEKPTEEFDLKYQYVPLFKVVWFEPVSAKTAVLSPAAVSKYVEAFTAPAAYSR
jgi:hypothetical protein